MAVLVFRTNINSDERIHRAACQICKLRSICRWSIDLEDYDCVLRIEADSVNEADVIRMLTSVGLECNVLN